MADYFGEHSTFISSRGFPSPADTPYETPGFLRSKRSSRANTVSREQSSSPPPLPPDASEASEKSREGRYSALDPRRFTPTLHASLVSEILNLRRELDSKNILVENLETNLAGSRTDNEALTEQVARHQRDTREAKQHLLQLEAGTYDAIEAIAKERDVVKQSAEDVKSKLEAVTKKNRRQEEDAARSQSLWEQEKESWENERRQLERRVHVTEGRLRLVVDEMSTQQITAETPAALVDEADDSTTFKDSGFGNESDAASIRSATPVKHRRNASSISFRSRSLRNSASTRASAGTPDHFPKVNGYSLADELDIDEEDEYDLDEFEHGDDQLDYPEPKSRSRMDSMSGGAESKAKRVLGLDSELPNSPGFSRPRSPVKDRQSTCFDHAESLQHDSALTAIRAVESAQHSKPRAEYVDNGYQPSPPSTPRQTRNHSADGQTRIPTVLEPVSTVDTGVQTERPISTNGHGLGSITSSTAPPASPPPTPVVAQSTWEHKAHAANSTSVYATASTQTDVLATDRTTSSSLKRHSLSPPEFVPSIAIHPPTSRPNSPRAYVLPPGTKNASVQTNLRWPGCDAAVQTEEIRVDKRLRLLPASLQPASLTAPRSSLLPSPTFPDVPRPAKQRPSNGGTAIIFTNSKSALEASIPSPPLQSPMESSPEVPRNNSSKSLRDLPLRAIPLGRPVLAPVRAAAEGPLNRSSQYGVTRPLQTSSQLASIDKDSDDSSDDDAGSDLEPSDITGSMPVISRAPPGRFGLSNPPKVVPEDKEVSPDRRPETAGSYGAAPAPSVASSRATTQPGKRPMPKYSSARERSPSFGSAISSTYSIQSVAPPYPIPRRSSSRVLGLAASEGSRSPTPHHGSGDVFARGGIRGSRSHHARQVSLRKVQSATAIRGGKTSPTKRNRGKRSPDLTPIQSMHFDMPTQTRFPIPELPTPLQEQRGFHIPRDSTNTTLPPGTAVSDRRMSAETALIDSIAGTMVGEWMWKYIRKRKSFGITDEAANNFAQDSVNGAINITSHHGTRHKRWVWLSPYERTVMWDSKQPTSGTALLGKKGRKLAIQSVIDVEDNTPIPKGAELSSAFNRSILILTPERALKFTAVSAARHELWMTALSFLARSGQLPGQIPAAQPARPPIPSYEPLSTQQQHAPSFGRAKVRDSVRLAKGKRPIFQHTATHPAPSDSNATALSEPPQDEGADFPAVPRLYIATAKHQRKRSNTSPRLPPPLSALRSVSYSAIASSNTSSRLHPSMTTGSSNRHEMGTSSSRSGSRHGSGASPTSPNFFEAVGTVRMEAFVDPSIRNGVVYVPAPLPPMVSTPHGPRRKRGDSHLSVSTFEKRRAGFVFDENGYDPFKGF
ncbi:hypothetical protein LTR62_002747 [Meristemomyces frigidus]|uniref:Pleckstrin homology domain-containing protein n=1 Tax=Meristemomyces frigidus TaxID=1508187 RepID=A0AAN7YS28_9PEZI|nr:hypothetical protein LTR62_002747 [Meristemomyces frigidus]